MDKSGRRLHDLQGEARWETSSSVELAEHLYDEAVSHAVAYCSQMDEPAAVIISEEAKEARKRAPSGIPIPTIHRIPRYVGHDLQTSFSPSHR